MENSNNQKIYKYTNGNTSYDIETQRLYIYNGIITSPVISYKYEGNYQISKTQSGTTYITVPPTYFKGSYYVECGNNNNN
jgi:hypothetical protein